ncbi:putative T7SS-secreted protein [Streptomyces xanthophaeus]|uniref:putative T7SS-secreted protein n=1 Tax=Streptomyces xanthophaeus TaxID=67385 RepID=UPI003429CB2E
MVSWDDLGRLTDKGIDLVDKGIDKGKELLGEGIDKGTDALGAGLKNVGAEGWADSVEDWGDETASSLGAEVGEQQLGQSEEPNELIHGNPGKIGESVKNLRDFQAAFDLVGAGMKKLDSASWKGEAANSFRESIQTLPTDWLHAADAFENAAQALESYATAVTTAQGKAREAIDLYKEGQADRQKAADAYNKKVDAYNDARNGDSPLPHPGEFSDPGEGKRQRAQEILKAARSTRKEAADTAKSAVTAAMAHAPKEPTGREKAKLELADFALGQGVEMMHFGGGIVKGAAGLVNFVRAINPGDPYNITHPAEYYENINMTLAGLVSTAANPDRALMNAWDAAKGDPAEFLGRLVPELIGTKGAGVLRGGIRAGMRSGMDDLAASGARKTVDADPAKTSRPPNTVESGDTDPIDLATGAMFLPQTDIVLPGTLPLVFRRRAASDYRSGRWFGSSWASTVDQRLEIDSTGVVFVCEDGMLLSYPHPAPGAPVLPSHGPRWPLDRDASGDYTVTDPDTGQVRHFATRPDGGSALLAQLDDRNGNWIVLEYDAAGAPASLVHHGGYHLKLTTGGGRITALHLAGAAADRSDQEILRYGYDDGNLTSVINSSGLPLGFTYDGQARITSWTDTNGSRYDYTYDALDRCISQGGAEGHVALSLDYGGTDPETGLRVTTTTTAAGAVRQYVVNGSHQIVKETDPLGAVTRFERDRYNRLLSRTDALGRTHRYTYDAMGRLTATVRPDGREATAEYNALGLPTRVVNPDRTSIRQEYDARGNRTSVTDPSGATTRYTYDEAGRLTGITDALGHTTRVATDGAGLPVEVTDPLGATTRTTRDAFGRPIVLTDALGGTTGVRWTPEGRLAARIAADGSEESWTYDGEGNCLTHTNAMGAVSRFEYTHFDLMAARTGFDGVRHEFTYDHDLRLTRVRGPQGGTWDYAYDRAGRLVSESDFDDRLLAYERDAAGRITARTDAAGRTMHYTWDDLDRLVAKDAAGAVSTFAYDFSDQLAEAVNDDATITFVRDRHGRLVSETVDGRTVSYTYDRLGRRLSRTTPAGATSTRTYDAAGRRTSLTTSGRTLTFEHDAAGREIARHIGGSTLLVSEFDGVGRLSGQEVTSGGRSIQRRDYSYRADGHLTGIHDRLTGLRTFELDPVGRITSVDASQWTERYAYDEVGNQTEASWPAAHSGHEATGSRAYSGTSITRAGRVRYEHDALGRTTLRQRRRLSRKPETWHYTWDADNRLTAVTTPDGTCWHYRYDALGRRISKRHLADDGTLLEHIAFTWDGDMLCEQTTRGSVQGEPEPDQVTLSWDHQGARPLTQTERRFTADSPQEAVDERFFSIVTDLIGSPRELVDESGELAWYTRSTVWGSTAWASSSTAYTPFRFPGQYFDPETGLHYNRFRYYDPESARYASPDPLGVTPAPNPVAYVGNPYRRSDPLGLSPCGGGIDYMEDNRIPAGDPVTHSPTGTLVGTDGQSTRNFNNVANAGEHDVVAHGSPEGWLEMPHGNVNAGQLVDAVTNNPHYNGGPLRLMVCHSGSDGSWIAQRIANELGTTVRAPTDRVGTDRLGGTGQTPVIDKGGYWRVFLPMLEG